MIENVREDENVKRGSEGLLKKMMLMRISGLTSENKKGDNINENLRTYFRKKRMKILIRIHFKK